MDIERATLVERTARLTLVARLTRLWIEAVDSLGEDTRTRCFAHSARAAEEVSVRQAVGGHGMLERGGDGALSDDGVEGGRTVFSR